MNRFLKLLILSLVGVFALGSQAHARRGYNSGMMRQYAQMQQRMMQMEQKAMMEAMARQAAIEKHHREMHAKANKARHDKEEQAREAAISKRKAEQGSQTRSSSSSTPKK